MASLYNSGHTMFFDAAADHKAGDVVDFRTSGPIPFWGVIIRDVKSGEEGTVRIDGAFRFETETTFKPGDPVSYVDGAVVAYDPSAPDAAANYLGVIVEKTRNGFTVVKINTGAAFAEPDTAQEPEGPAA